MLCLLWSCSTALLWMESLCICWPKSRLFVFPNVLDHIASPYLICCSLLALFFFFLVLSKHYPFFIVYLCFRVFPLSIWGFSFHYRILVSVVFQICYPALVSSLSLPVIYCHLNKTSWVNNVLVSCTVQVSMIPLYTLWCILRYICFLLDGIHHKNMEYFLSFEPPHSFCFLYRNTCKCVA